MLATKQQKYKITGAIKNLPNLASTVISKHSVISQYLFTGANKLKYDFKVI